MVNVSWLFLFCVLDICVFCSVLNQYFDLFVFPFHEFQLLYFDFSTICMKIIIFASNCCFDYTLKLFYIVFFIVVLGIL